MAIALAGVKIFQPKVSGDARVSGKDAEAPAFEDAEYF
ncbi:hypothetical protein BLA18109_06247 [Burkholderia lata]|uniref:Uncharacterized protein n=1 Tax=Burkholderia lata (strain ATCC 17760 / DSM 23089 / LMG 22485 / NCIMB 9086 / R18194 / 383) TaxID=482957 RepID=A0A6P2YSE1_BURL3|nr:hypothetical protein BLA18109_06247 [Burkholderia lata]